MKTASQAAALLALASGAGSASAFVGGVGASISRYEFFGCFCGTYLRHQAVLCQPSSFAVLTCSTKAVQPTADMRVCKCVNTRRA